MPEVTPGEWVALCGGVTLLIGAFWRFTRAIYRLVRIGETALTRLVRVEDQLKTNGGNSARDILDQIHAVASANAEASARLEDGQRRAATLAGTAAALAGTADQRIRDLGVTATKRHRDNTSRLERLEGAAREERMRRELYLATLRELYGIELPEPD